MNSQQININNIQEKRPKTSGLQQQSLRTKFTQKLNFQHYLSFLVIPEDALSNNIETNQTQPLISNIPLATVTNDELLVAIFLFKLEELLFTPLFSKVTLEKKPITIIYTNVKIDDHSIKLILDSCQVDCTVSVKIITTNRVTKTPIGKIDDLLIKVNGIIIPIKELQLSQNTTCGHFKPITTPSTPLIKFDNEKGKST
ncbi:hypothetical protein G9A89_009088 [Geosiphon pyriformis]|nr:hypothetical protein G9A89_009088 [Geosiphon pyriformis]